MNRPLIYLALVIISRSATAAPVINEIHYNNDLNTVRNEFVELHNPDATDVDLGNWQLTGAIEFTFPAGTMLPANGYLVVAEDPATIASDFSVTALGPYTGSLNSTGELLELVNASLVEIDRVDYGVGFPWPSQARGEGSSMELINPALDNDLGSSWRSSATGFAGTAQTLIAEASDWHYRKGFDEASDPIHAWTANGFVEDGSWLAGQTPIGRGENDFTNTIIGDVQNNYVTVFLRKEFTISGPLPSALALSLFFDDGVIIWLNGTEIFRSATVDSGVIDFQGNDENNAGGDGTAIGSHEKDRDGIYEKYTIGGTAALLQAGTNTIAIQLFNERIGSSDILIDAALETPPPFTELAPPSPGKANSSATVSPPPNIRQVEHLPQSPSSSDPVVVSAKITDPDGVASVTLSYQVVEPGSYIRKDDPGYEDGWIDLPMTDLDNDDTYTATIPAGTHRHLMRYRITTIDGGGSGVRAPFVDDGQPNFAYFVYDGVPDWTAASNPGTTPTATFGAAVLERFPTYHLIANGTDVNNSQYSSGSDGVHMQGTLVYDGKVYDHIEFENRGEASTYQSGKNKWRFHFNRGREFEARDDWGKKYASALDTLNFDACASPWAPVHRGMAGVEEAVSYRLFGLAGMHSPRTHYVHFRVVDASSESGANQYSSDLWGLYLAVEHPDGSFLDDRGLPDGNVYKIESNNGDKKHQAKDQSANASDWTTFRSSSNSTQNEAYWNSTMNLPAYYTFRAGNRITGNVDVREGFNHYFYNDPVAGWTVMPWDLDMMFIAETHWSGTIQQKACLNVPALAIDYRNRARELFDLLCTDTATDGGQMAQLIDEYAQMVNPAGQPLTWSDVDEYMWNYHTRTRGNANTHSGQGNHKGNWFYTPFVDSRIGGTYTRTLASSDHEGSMGYLHDYVTDTFPGVSWAPGNGEQRGYGYEFLKRDASDTSIPNTPTITYTGTAGFPTTGLSFQSSSFSDPQGSGTFATMQWRIGEIGTSPDGPWTYEIEENWSSGELAPFAASLTPPAAASKPGRTYRARVRHKDTTGRWSHWSAPVQFVASGPDVTALQQDLVISEIMYNPATGQEHEYVELFNIGDTTLDLTDLRFTKGIDFDFPAGTTIAPGAYLLVVKDPAAFEAQHGAGLPVAGEYGTSNSASLSNKGELLKLSVGSVAIHEFEYDDKSPWPTDPDGGGKALVLSHTSDNAANNPLDPLGHGIASNWRPGATGGTPGAGETTSSFSGDPDADADNDGLSAFMEHALGTSDNTPSSTGFVTISVDEPAQTLLIVYKNSNADDVRYIFETSTDLNIWTPAPLESQAGGSLIFDITPTPNLAHLYSRLRVEQVTAIPR